MGWIEETTHFSTQKERAEYVRSLFDVENLCYFRRDGTVYYVAVRQGERVQAYVVQTYQKFERVGHVNVVRVFGYKIESEDVCPAHHEAPYAMLRVLTPTDNEQALKWRDLCRRTLKNRHLLQTAPVGTRIRIADSAADDMVIIFHNGRRFLVNERRTIQVPISLATRHELQVVRNPLPTVAADR